MSTEDILSDLPACPTPHSPMSSCTSLQPASTALSPGHSPLVYLLWTRPLSPVPAPGPPWPLSVPTVAGRPLPALGPHLGQELLIWGQQHQGRTAGLLKAPGSRYKLLQERQPGDEEGGQWHPPHASWHSPPSPWPHLASARCTRPCHRACSSAGFSISYSLSFTCSVQSPSRRRNSCQAQDKGAVTGHKACSSSMPSSQLRRVCAGALGTPAAGTCRSPHGLSPTSSPPQAALLHAVWLAGPHLHSLCHCCLYHLSHLQSSGPHQAQEVPGGEGFPWVRVLVLV